MIMIAINPMYYGTLGFLMFSGMLLSIGFWAIHGLKKERAKKAPHRLCHRGTGISLTIR
jgi:hypothetical protein